MCLLFMCITLSDLWPFFLFPFVNYFYGHYFLEVNLAAFVSPLKCVSRSFNQNCFFWSSSLLKIWRKINANAKTLFIWFLFRVNKINAFTHASSWTYKNRNQFILISQQINCLLLSISFVCFCSPVWNFFIDEIDFLASFITEINTYSHIHSISKTYAYAYATFVWFLAVNVIKCWFIVFSQLMVSLTHQMLKHCIALV